MEIGFIMAAMPGRTSANLFTPSHTKTRSPHIECQAAKSENKYRYSTDSASLLKGTVISYFPILLFPVSAKIQDHFPLARSKLIRPSFRDTIDSKKERTLEFLQKGLAPQPIKLMGAKRFIT